MNARIGIENRSIKPPTAIIIGPSAINKYMPTLKVSEASVTRKYSVRFIVLGVGFHRLST